MPDAWARRARRARLAVASLPPVKARAAPPRDVGAATASRVLHSSLLSTEVRGPRRRVAEAPTEKLRRAPLRPQRSTWRRCGDASPRARRSGRPRDRVGLRRRGTRCDLGACGVWHVGSRSRRARGAAPGSPRSTPATSPRSARSPRRERDRVHRTVRRAPSASALVQRRSRVEARLRARAPRGAAPPPPTSCRRRAGRRSCGSSARACHLARRADARLRAARAAPARPRPPRAVVQARPSSRRSARAGRGVDAGTAFGARPRASSSTPSCAAAPTTRRGLQRRRGDARKRRRRWPPAPAPQRLRREACGAPDVERGVPTTPRLSTASSDVPLADGARATPPRRAAHVALYAVASRPAPTSSAMRGQLAAPRRSRRRRSRSPAALAAAGGAGSRARSSWRRLLAAPPPRARRSRALPRLSRGDVGAVRRLSRAVLETAPRPPPPADALGASAARRCGARRRPRLPPPPAAAGGVAAREAGSWRRRARPCDRVASRGAPRAAPTSRRRRSPPAPSRRSAPPSRAQAAPAVDGSSTRGGGASRVRRLAAELRTSRAALPAGDARAPPDLLTLRRGSDAATSLRRGSCEAARGAAARPRAACSRNGGGRGDASRTEANAAARGSAAYGSEP